MLEKSLLVLYNYNALGGVMRGCLSRVGGKRILVVGDLFLDVFLYGSAERISPEAPVPVVKVSNQKKVLGGAGNVANNLRELDCVVDLVSVVGQDANGEEVCELLGLREIGSDGIQISSLCPTIVKTRIISDDQHVVRWDVEERFEKDQPSQLQVYRFVSSLQSDCYDAIILVDYSKGTISHQLVSLIKSMFSESTIVADFKPEHFLWYNGIYSISPNLKEARMMCGFQDPHEIVKNLKQQLDLSTSMITLSDKGIIVVDESDDVFHFPAYKLQTRERHHRMDVAGAGDTVLSVFTACVCSGIPSSTSAFIANVAAAVVVNKLGTATCSVDELLTELENVSEEVVTEFCRTNGSIIHPSVEGSPSSTV